MADSLYTYAVARIRSKELKLLSRSDLEQLMACSRYEDCLRALSDKGWGRTGDETAEQLLAVEREKTWDLINELVEDMSVFDVFLYEKDFHNLKAAIKQAYMKVEMPGIFMNNGSIDKETIIGAVSHHDFSELPEYMRAAAEEAFQVQMHTGDGQLCEIIIDKAALESICLKGRESGSRLLADYTELKAAVADINIAIRGCRTRKNRDFLKRALASCRTLDADKLAETAVAGMDALFGYLEGTAYSEAVQAFRESPSAFERWCDNMLIGLIRPQKYNPFTLEPLAAYILARENEIKSVRILLSGKLNGLPENSIRERLREMYV